MTSLAALWSAFRFSLVAALTAWAAMLSWRGFTEAADRFLVPLLGVAVVVALVGIGFFVYRKKKSSSRRRRDSMPYDEEFESLQKKHEEKFGVGHNY